MNQVASTAEISFASASSEGGGSEVFDMVEQKDGELARLQLKEERRLKESSQKVDALISALRVQRAACQHLDDQLTRRMQDVQEGIGNATRNCRQQRYALAVKMQQLIDEHVAEVGGCQKEEDAIYKESEAYTAEIRNEICYLYKDIDENRKIREDQGQNLEEAILQKLSEVREAVSAEQRIRLESRNTLLELFGQMTQKVELEMESAKRERHVATDRMISTMEQTLPKIRAARRQGKAHTQSQEV
eukprot:TRINITY_DN9513_c0_g1_i1.p1 TRINITY_DN9513_c0_g1~~TRINITY_DN9513_c0_g1_i1.p1  ORF type:complete len:246 (+),score=72.04 TRINITY_DN9513_c0_g1_i1:119-856(+)